jgi:hypothetical protein
MVARIGGHLYNFKWICKIKQGKDLLEGRSFPADKWINNGSLRIAAGSPFRRGEWPFALTSGITPTENPEDPIRSY